MERDWKWVSFPVSENREPGLMGWTCLVSLSSQIPTAHDSHPSLGNSRGCPQLSPASHAYLRGPPGPVRPPSNEAAFRGGGSSGRRGAALARVDTRRRSGRSSLRLRRKRCAPCALRARHSLPSRPWDTTSSKRARCFLGMKILQGPSTQAPSLTAFQRHLLVARLPIPRGDQGHFHSPLRRTDLHSQLS